MSTSSKTPNTIRQGDPGPSHENAKEPVKINKPAADDPILRHSRVCGGGGEHDSHHAHRPTEKGGGSHPAGKGKP